MGAAYLGAKPAPVDLDATRKQYETLRARLALRGYTLHRLDDAGGFLVGRWNLTRALPDLPAVQAFTESIGA